MERKSVASRDYLNQSLLLIAKDKTKKPNKQHKMKKEIWKKKKGKTWKFNPTVKPAEVDHQIKKTQKGNLPRSAVYSLRKGPSKSSKTSQFQRHVRYGLAPQTVDHCSNTPEGDERIYKDWENLPGDEKYAIIL